MNNTMKPRILLSMPTKHHVEIAIDEMTGLQHLGYDCAPFPYAAEKGVDSKIGRFRVIIQNAFKLIQIARGFNPDIIYLNSRLEKLPGIRDALTIALFRAFYHQKVRFIIKSHGSDIAVLSSRQFLISRIALPYLKRNIAAWLFLSTQERDEVLQHPNFSNQHVFVTKNIIRKGQFKTDHTFKERMNIPADYKVLLFVGRIIKEKGIFEVIEAFSMIAKKHKVVLVINGDGPELENVKKTISSYRITAQVICTGWIPEQEIVPYYANSDVLLFPTFFPEGFPMALFNSVGAGLSIITTKIRAASDFLTEPENCLWVKPHDSRSVYTALHTLLQSPGLMADMRKNNIAMASLFSQEQVAAELAQMMERIFKP